MKFNQSMKLPAGSLVNLPLTSTPKLAVMLCLTRRSLSLSR